MPREISLMRKYAPKTIAELCGQSFVRFHLGEFLATPYSTAFLFSGAPGCGKTSGAYALANELGAHPTSGVWKLSGTDQSEDTLDAMVRDLRFAPFGGGWRVIVVDEADWIVRCPKAYLRWNGILDDGATRTVFVFTTNESEKFSERFLRRVQHLPFTSDYLDIAHEAQELVGRIWRGEGMTSVPPSITAMPDIMRDGKLSVGEVVRNLEFSIREAREKTTPPPTFTLKTGSDTPRTLFQAAAVRPKFEYDRQSGKLVKAS